MDKEINKCDYCGNYCELVIDDEFNDQICSDCLELRNEADYKYCEY